MKIKVPYNKAIQLLEARLLDLENPEIDIQALKNRLQSDIAGIFGPGSETIKVIGLNTLHFGDSAKLAQIKTTFKQTIEGWIEYIRDFNVINQEIIENSEEEYKAKYLTLVSEYNHLLGEYENLKKHHSKVLGEIQALKDKRDSESKVGEIIRILFLGASPVDEVRVRVDKEIRDIQNGIRLASLRECFYLKSESAVTAKSLQLAMLSEKPNIVHFSGHGDTEGIVLEDEFGNAKLVENDAIGELFKLFSEHVYCVFLNSCYSESQAIEISKHIPYVICMRNSVPDKAAILFSVGFYTALGSGKDINFAFKMGVLNLKLEKVSGSEIPVLIG